ncbi:hypothetical protein LOAG_16409 [Loa loa]|uniref:Uncharacterized protein n=1 Tax=Loa loa TaxID=7209 RepID=A0A1S0UMB6_LOALO|nr:hypothetical protein LOAG_16409 [Loa loa]EJD76739.1 hypothetical protein LOAG_16409 [Loa loa]
MPHWVQLTTNGYSTDEFVKMIDEVLGANQVIAQKHEMKLPGLVKGSLFSETEKTEQEANFSNPLNMPSTSTALIPGCEANLYKNSKTTSKEGVDSINNTFHLFTKTANTAIANTKDASYSDRSGMVS